MTLKVPICQQPTTISLLSEAWGKLKEELQGLQWYVQHLYIPTRPCGCHSKFAKQGRWRECEAVVQALSPMCARLALPWPHCSCTRFDERRRLGLSTLGCQHYSLQAQPNTALRLTPSGKRSARSNSHCPWSWWSFRAFYPFCQPPLWVVGIGFVQRSHFWFGFLGVANFGQPNFLPPPSFRFFGELGRRKFCALWGVRQMLGHRQFDVAWLLVCNLASASVDWVCNLCFSRIFQESFARGANLGRS